ncbi:polycystic kidney disease protein 1-like 2 isoform X2 [Acanthaster planci]|uniref:Polycystic kidney disease protein 1-like 2 isoform X2 n=1 Tax=Acanthaster planci TaxID=133434 RepID=A0A8B7ZQA2_ACAPL|nr:polycystic kidney disease protein 1-like 2 isoform X2 [Acanthaster planci]
MQPCKVSAPSEVSYKDPVIFIFQTDYTREPYIMCSWDFGDENQLFTTATELQLGISHQYSHPGYYTVLTSCQTSFGRIYHHTQVAVFRDIDWLQCVITDTNAVVQEIFRYGSNIVVHYRHEYTIGLHYSLLIDNVEVYEAIASTMKIQTTVVEDSLIITEYLQHLISLGSHDLTLRVRNGRVDLQCLSTFTLMNPVLGVTLASSHSTVIPRDDVLLAVTAESGFPAMIEWSITNGPSVVLRVLKERQGRLPEDVDQMTISLLEIAEYQICAKVYNNFTSEEACISIVTQYPVTSVILESNTPINFAVGNTVQFSVQFLDRPIPTSMRYSVDFGDGASGNSSMVGITDSSSFLIIPHTYTTPGIYHATLHVCNDLSSTVNSTRVAVLQPITHMTIRLSHHSGIYFPSSERDWFWQEPLFLHPIVTENEYSFELKGTGTPELVTWRVAGHTQTYHMETTGRNLFYRFPSNGTFNLQATASNFYSSYTTVDASVLVLDAIVSLYLVSNSPGIVGEPITFVVLVESLGSNSSFSVSYGDGFSEPLPEPQHNIDIMQFVPRNLALPTDPAKSYATVMNHTYQEVDFYAPRVTGSNLAMEWIAITYVYVQDVAHLCRIPVIHIRDGGSSYYLAKKYSRSKAFIFGASVEINCQQAKRAHYQWRVYTVDSLFTVPSPSNEVGLPPSVNAQAADMYIPGFTLGYGMYIFQLSVTLVMKEESEASMENVAHSYIEVIPAGLVARIRGGSALATGWYSNITLDASDSFDPDQTPDRASLGLSYTWYCRKSNEPFPENMTLTPHNRLPSTGGCLGKGFLLSQTSTSVVIPAQTLTGNQSYVILLKLSKTGRESAYAEQTIIILLGHPNSIYIRCLMNCGSQLNPSARLVLAGLCPDCTASTRPSFEWSLRSSNHSTAAPALDWARNTTTGKHHPYLAINAGTFSGSSQETYTIHLQMQSRSGSISFAEYTFTVNSPPTTGNCTITPAEGVVLTTHFSIICEHFEDIHTPLTYEVHTLKAAERSVGVGAHADASVEDTLLFYGLDPNIPATLLPLGQPSQGYRVDIKIKVTDSLGASVYTLLSAVVRESESDDPEALALQLTSDKYSKLNQLMEEGNVQAATQVITSVGSLLNLKSERDNQHQDHGVIEQAVENKHKEELEDQKKKRAQARESLLDMLSKVKVNSLESIQLTSSAISQVTSEVEEISPQAQVSTASAFLSMGSWLKEQADMGVDGDVVEGAATSMVSGLSNIMSSATITQSGNVSDYGPIFESERTQQTRNVTMASLHALDDMQAAILLNKVPGEQPTILQTSSLSVILQRQEKRGLDGLVLQTENSDVVFRLPAGLSTVIDQHQASSNNEVIDTQIHHFQQNPFSWAKSSSLVTTHVTSLRLGHGDDQSEIAVQTLPQNVEIMVTNGDSVMPVLQPLAGQQTNHSYSFNVTNPDAAVIIRIQLNQSSGLTEVLPLHLCLRFELATSDTEPLCNASVTMPRAATDPHVFLNSTNMTFDPYLWVIPSENLPEVGRYYLTLDGGDGTDVTNKQYHVYAFSTQCLFWDKTREEWLGDGCKVGPFTTAAQTHCLCNHLTSFAASFLVLPNPVDLTDFSLFATIPDNPITVVTVAVVFVLFGLCAVWAHRKDRIEREKARLIILADNDQEDTYRYHVTVFTGVRRGAGTTAVVTLTLQGIVGNSEPHVLSSDREHHKVLQRSSVDSFLLTTRESLGILRSVRLWHDNGGSSPAWYLSRILVHDLETDRWWYFLCHTWIAVDLSDGKIDKTFPVANTEDLKDFHHLFFTRSVRDMKDNHLWLSVLSRPPRSSFTRLQRVACCFSLLLSSMLMNIMFYKVGEGEPDKTYNFGVMSLSVKTIVIATEASLLALPINLAIVQIFREARPREKEEVEIVPASESGDSQDQTYQEQEDKGSLDPQGVNLSKAGCADTDASLRSSSIQSQTSSMPKSASRGSTQHKVSQPQNPRREDTKPLASRESLPERDIFSSDKAYEEYTDKYAEFVYLRSTCTSANASSHRSLETGSWHSMIPLERNPSSIHAQQAFRLDLLPECDQALMSTNMTELTKTARNSNANHNSSSSESSIQPRSSQSNTTSCSASSIKILISPSEESSIDPGSSDSVIYTSYQDFLSSRLNRLYEQLHNPSPGLFRSDQDRQKALRKFKLALALHGWREERERESGSESSNETLPEQKDKVQKLFSGRGFLPWWWVYIGWFLAISSSLFAAYLIILYGLTFGKQKSLDWLVSMIVSLFQSIVVIQPVKVIAIAAFFAIVLKSYDYDEIGVTFFKQLKIYAGGQQSSTTSTQSKHRDSHFYQPPTGRAVEQAREKRHAERKMYSLIKAFLGHLVFIWLVLQVSIAQRDPAGIYLSLAMRSSFTTKLDQVKTMPDVYTWIKGEFAPSLYEAEPGTALQESLLVGSPRLRQQRVKPGYLQHCRELDTYRYLRPGCYAVRGTELDQGAYNASWTQPLSSNNTSQHQSRSPWVYQSHWQAKGSYFLTDPGRYNRGGFLLDLGTTRASTANQTALLQDLGWVDQYTQAIILEWVVYNANTNLFCACTVVFRAEGTTTVVPSHEFAIVCIYRYTNKYDKFVVILEVLYVMVVTVIMGMEVLKWKNNRREYWAFWNVLNIAIIILSISATTAYIWQHVLANNIMQLYKANHNMHLSFADIVVLDSVLVTSLASVAFCSLLKCLKILHYNDSMYLLHSTFRRLTKTLLIYLSMLTVTFVAFAYYGYLSFGRQFRDFCDLLRSIQCVFMLILRRYSDMLDIMEAFGMQAYFFFALANFFLIAVIVNLFIAMLLHCYSAARSEFVRYKDHDLVSMLTEWFLSAFSIKGQYKRVHKHNSIASLESL